MEDAENLLKVLELLDTSWSQVSSELTDEQLLEFKNDLEDFQQKIESSESREEINKTARDFYQICSDLKYLKDISEAEFPDIRGASLPEKDEEIKIKIINYCETLASRMHLFKDESK
jgi:hypothetical protein